MGDLLSIAQNLFVHLITRMSFSGILAIYARHQNLKLPNKRSK